ncbi:MAG: RNA-guided pseudouridylation complex pseudouridine synthase subunit Cbf5 [Desulfurococcales archaeon]|nr:RNA-guided pseudouridylation complex pseudouridine synthase subunit Cbf5 [Desulfurococcales archaeon]
MRWGNPKTSGILPIALGSATKLLKYLSLSRKAYVAVMQLHREVNEDRLREVVQEFTGKIYQKPPVRSSVKRALRVKTIYKIEIIEIKHPFVLLYVECEHGTYIRKLIHDMGDVLGVGAHMRELRRVRTGPFKEDDTLVTMHSLSEAVYILNELRDDSQLRKAILPGEYCVSHLPKVVVTDSAAASITYGADLAVPGISYIHQGIRKGDDVAIFTLKGELVATGIAQMHTEEVLEKGRGIAVKTKRVIMGRDVYPRKQSK